MQDFYLSLILDYYVTAYKPRLNSHTLHLVHVAELLEFMILVAKMTKFAAALSFFLLLLSFPNMHVIKFPSLLHCISWWRFLHLSLSVCRVQLKQCSSDQLRKEIYWFPTHIWFKRFDAHASQTKLEHQLS